jgi:hypothetical protein
VVAVSLVRDALKALNIGAVALREVDIPGWWDLIAMFSFLSNPETAFMADRGENLRIYIVDETRVGQYNLSVESIRSQALAYLEQSRTYLQQARPEESFAAYQEAEALYPAVIEELTEEEREMVAAARQMLQSEESPTPRRGLKTSITIFKTLRVLVWVELGLLVGVIVLALSLWITLERFQGGASSGTERKSG